MVIEHVNDFMSTAGQVASKKKQDRHISTHLDDGFGSADLQHLPTALGAIGQSKVDNLGILWKLHRANTRIVTVSILIDII